MAVKNFLKWPDKRLRSKANEITEITEDINSIWDDMIDTMNAMPGIGLAAPQIGINLRLAVVDASKARDKPVKLANLRFSKHHWSIVKQKRLAQI